MKESQLETLLFLLNEQSVRDQQVYASLGRKHPLSKYVSAEMNDTTLTLQFNDGLGTELQTAQVVFDSEGNIISAVIDRLRIGQMEMTNPHLLNIIKEWYAENGFD